MARWRCVSCGGRYEDTQTGAVDGNVYSYFHACPPGTVDPRDENVVEVKDPSGRPIMEPDPEKKNQFRSVRKLRSEGRGRVRV